MNDETDELDLDTDDPMEDEPSYKSPFEALRHQTEDGQEYWLAREFARLLTYADYRSFLRVIARARLAAANVGQVVESHFQDGLEIVEGSNGTKRHVEDIRLSRYACYLILQNADPSKLIVAQAQAYFARSAYVLEQVSRTEAQKRLYLRHKMSDHNKQLAEAASESGVVKNSDFAIFQDHGYMGLYGGLKTREIHERKGLKKGQQVLDHMGSEELAANLFRATQTEAKLRREQIQDKEVANQIHQEMGRKVREFIIEVGNTLPEDLPNPRESIQQLQQREKKRLERGPQLSMFDEADEE